MSLDKLAGRSNLYPDVKEFNLIEKIEPLLRAGFFFRKEDGKISARLSHIWDIPWISVKRDQYRECMLWHQILFRHMDVVPSFCLNCWKVVARPNTLHEMFQLHDLMVDWDRSSKIGIEVRAYVQSLYGAYFYNNSLEEGKDCLDFVKDGTLKHIGKELSDTVHLKRYCTEFELKYGDSDKFVQRPEDRTWEKLVHESFAFEDFPLSADPPPLIKQHIVQKLIEYAAKMKDPTVAQYNNGKQPMPEIVKYGRSSVDPSKIREGNADPNNRPGN